MPISVLLRLTAANSNKQNENEVMIIKIEEVIQFFTICISDRSGIYPRDLEVDFYSLLLFVLIICQCTSKLASVGNIQ